LQVQVRFRKIQHYIRTKQISPNQLAKTIGITREYLNRIIRGKYLIPGNQVIAGLLHWTKLSFDELFVVVPDPVVEMVSENLLSYSSED